MNAIPSVSQPPITGDATQTGTAASPESAGHSANGQDFAAALRTAGSRSTRKPAANKADDGRQAGGQLPAPGNLSPPPTLTPAAAVAAASSAAATAGGAVDPTAAHGATPGVALGTAAILGAQAKATDLNSGSALPRAGAVPGTLGTTPSTAAAALGTAGTVPGTAGAALGTMGSMPGAAGAAPSTTGALPGAAGAALGTTGSVSGTASATLGSTGTVPGTAGAALGATGTAPATAGAALGTGGAALASTGTTSGTTAAANQEGRAQGVGLPAVGPQDMGARSGNSAAITDAVSISVQAVPVAEAATPTPATMAQAAGATPSIDSSKGSPAAQGGNAARVRSALTTPAGAMAGTAVNPAMVAGVTARVAAAIKAAVPGPSAENSQATTPTNTGTGTNSGATAPTATATAPAALAIAQIATAAVMPATAASIVAGTPGLAGAADSPSSSMDHAATPATGSVAQDAGGPMSAPALAVSDARPAAAGAAAVNAQEITALANASESDKHVRGGAGDSMLSGSSGGVADPAQLSVNTTTTAADVTPTPTLKIAAGVDTSEFGQGLGDRVSWMVDNNLSGAKLQVNPPQLGPIEVRIAVQGDHAQVWLTSHSAVTRDALESSSPKLREMLGAQGFGQVSVDISQRSFQERSSQAQPYDWTPSANHSASTAPVSSAATSMPRTPSGVVDAYA